MSRTFSLSLKAALQIYPTILLPLKPGWTSLNATCVWTQTWNFMADDNTRKRGWMKQYKVYSSVPRLFADEILAFIFCFKREESMAMPAEHEVLPPHQPSPSFWKLSSPGSSGDVITVQSTCKTHSPGECISLIDHSWLLFLTARIRKWLLCSFPELKCIPRCHSQEK